MFKRRNNPIFPSRGIPGKHHYDFLKLWEQACASGTFWYSLALSSPTGLISLFYEHIHTLLSKNDAEEISEVMPFYWERDVGIFVAGKLANKKTYDLELRGAFAASSSYDDPSDT